MAKLIDETQEIWSALVNDYTWLPSKALYLLFGCEDPLLGQVLGQPLADVLQLEK